ncbi:MAG: MoaD/ThiS family protein [Thermoproteota archaeon]
MVESTVKVDFMGPFRDICRCGNLSLNVISEIDLLSLVKEVGGRFGEAFERRLGFDGFSYDGELAIVIVNGVVIDGSKLRETIIKPGDHITFAPSLAGGG